MGDLCVTVVQAQIAEGEVEANLAHYAELLTSIRDTTDLILLPEMFPTGYRIQECLIEPHCGRSVEWMQRIATHYNALVGGTIAVTDSGKNYNRFYLVPPTGAINYYDKRHLFPLAGEDKLFAAGAQRVIVSFRGWRIALQTCFDLRFPESARNRDDYDLLLYAAAWPADRDYAWRQLLIARAIENQTYLAAANRVGVTSKGMAYIGHSMVLDGGGNVCAELPDFREGILTAKLNQGKLAQLRTEFPFLPKV